jgi:hypothetical protein
MAQHPRLDRDLSSSTAVGIVLALKDRRVAFFTKDITARMLTAVPRSVQNDGAARRPIYHALLTNIAPPMP